MTRAWLRWAPHLVAVFAVLPVGLALLAFAGGGGEREGGDRAAVVALPDTLSGTGGLDSATGRALRAAPFRPDGRPSPVAYDPTRGEQNLAPEAPPRPALLLTGLVEGRRPLAVLEGVPGKEGAVVVAPGDTLAGLTIRRIKEGRVTVTGMDTTWTLTVRGTP